MKGPLKPLSCVGGHLELPAGGQWVPDDGHYGMWWTEGRFFDDDAHGPAFEGTPVSTSALWRVVRVFADNNLSAAREDRRPGYDELRAAVRAGEITHVWTVEQSRLGRRKAPWFELAAELIAAGIDEVHTRRDGLVRLDDIGSTCAPS